MKHIRGKRHQCFLNAIKQVAKHRAQNWKYVEGYIIVITAIHHAWALDENGEIVECTIPKSHDTKSKESDYHPCVVLTHDEAWERKCRTGYHAVMTKEESDAFYREFYKDQPAAVAFFTNDMETIKAMREAAQRSAEPPTAVL